MLHFVIRISAVFVLLLTVMPTGHTQELRTDGIFWESDTRYPAELGAQFGELYASLRKVLKQGFQIPTQIIKQPGKRTAEQVLRDYRLYFGTDFHRSADFFLCELNPHVCEIVGENTKWKNKVSDPMVLPDVQFERFTNIRQYRKSRGERLEYVVVNVLKGCQRFDAVCKDKIVNLNWAKRTQVLLPEFEGTVQLPVEAFRASIPLSLSRNEPIADVKPSSSQKTANKSSGIDLSPIGKSGVGKDISNVSRPVRLPKGEIDALQESLPKNAGIIVEPQRLFKKGAKTEAMLAPVTETEGDRTTILRLINHPYSLQENVQLPIATTVAIVDRWVSPGHCAYNQKKLYLDEGAISPDERLLGTAATKCGERAQANLERDHGTHIVGIVAGRRDTPLGPGVNPDAYVRTLQLDVEQLSSQPYRSRVAEKLGDMLLRDSGLKVFNFSLTYPFTLEPGSGGSVDSIETFILRGGGKTRLFVAAAGTGLIEPINRPRQCPLRPACLEIPNVITVGATDLTPRPACPNLLHGTNDGPGVDIVAPGLNIVSAIAKDKSGVLSGSSQAAPLVAAAASLLFAKDDTIKPLIVKNRLIYTADQCPALKVFGGRLNVRRALRYEHSELQVKVKDKLLTLEGNVVDLAPRVGFTDLDGKKSFGATIRAIKRLYKTDDGYFRVFYHSESPWDERSPLTRRDAFISTTPGQLHFKMADTNPVKTISFDVRDVVDYVGRVENQ